MSNVRPANPLGLRAGLSEERCAVSAALLANRDERGQSALDRIWDLQVSGWPDG